jgi:hypothetical protein
VTASALGSAKLDAGRALTRFDPAAGRFRFVPARLALSAWFLALVPIGLLQLTHSDLHEHNELPPLLHWIRDAALSVPFAAVAVVAAALVVAWLRPGERTGRGSLGTPVLWAFLAAASFAILSIPGNQLHGLLFGAEEEVGVSLAQDLANDAILAFQGALVVIVPFALLLGAPWQGRLRDPRPSRGTPSDGGPR